MNPIYWIIALSVIMLLSRGEKCGGIAREGDEFILTCSLASLDENVLWQLQEGTKYVNISSCGSSGTCTDLLPASFRATRKAVPQQSGQQNVGQLKILSALRIQSRFKCIRPGDVEEICNLQVYVRTEVPTCQAPSVVHIGTGTHLKVICSSERIYPMGKCNFTYKGVSSNISAEVTTSHSRSSQSTGDYKITCSWIALISGLDPGNIQVRVEVYPLLQNWVEAASEYSEWTQPTYLSFPTVALASDCPNGPSVRNGYILFGTQATCKCELKSAGYPPGHAQWYSESGGKLGTNQVDGSALLTLLHNNDTRFYCQPVSALRQPNPQQVNFSPQYAVGPVATSIHLSDSIPLCPRESHNYQVICKVPKATVAPQPLFTIIINNVTVVMNRRGQLDSRWDEYSLSYTFRPESGGSIRVYCRAVNEIFNEQFSEHERPLILDEPPKAPPFIKVNNGEPKPGNGVAAFTNGSNILLTCQVDGGYPEVSNVRLLCQENRATRNGTKGDLIISIPDGSRNLLCQCTATHVSGCYDKRTELLLTLDKPAENPDKVNPELTDTDTSRLSLTLGLGIGLGGTIFLLVVLVIVLFFYFKKKDVQCKESRDIQYSQPYSVPSGSYQYATVLAGRPVPPQTPPPYLLGQSDYDLITLDTDVVPKSLAATDNSQARESTTDPTQDNDVLYGYIQPI